MARQSQRRRGEAPRKSHRTSDGIPPRKTVLWQSCSGSLQPGTENLPAKAGQSLDRYPRSRSDHSSSWALWAIPTYRSSPERPRIASSILARLTLLSAGLPAYSTSLYSPAAAAFGTSSLSPAGIPSFVAAVSSATNSFSSSCASVFCVGSLLATLHSSRAASPAEIPSSLPSASLASASNSFNLVSSSRSLSPNRIKNSFDVLYRIGRPITSFRPAVVISLLSSSVLITPEVFTPRISEISGEVTGCLYAITASVSSAGMDSRNGGRKLLINRRTTSCCCGFVYSLYPPATARTSIPRSSAA